MPDVTGRNKDAHKHTHRHTHTQASIDSATETSSSKPKTGRDMSPRKIESENNPTSGACAARLQRPDPDRQHPTHCTLTPPPLIRGHHTLHAYMPQKFTNSETFQWISNNLLHHLHHQHEGYHHHHPLPESMDISMYARKNTHVDSSSQAFAATHISCLCSQSYISELAQAHQASSSHPHSPPETTEMQGRLQIQSTAKSKQKGSGSGFLPVSFLRFQTRKPQTLNLVAKGPPRKRL